MSVDIQTRFIYTAFESNIVQSIMNHLRPESWRFWMVLKVMTNRKDMSWGDRWTFQDINPPLSGKGSSMVTYSGALGAGASAKALVASVPMTTELISAVRLQNTRAPHYSKAAA